MTETATDVASLAARVERRGNVSLITINRPDARNAVNGAVSTVVPDGTVVEAALALAERITCNAPLSVQASKRVAYGADEGIIAAEEPKWEHTTREFTELLKSEDAKEGPRAFAEKRLPEWKAR